VAVLSATQSERARADEPQPTGALGEPHGDLTRAQKAIWLALAAELLPGVAGNSDRLAFRKLVCLEAKSRHSFTTASEEQLLRAYLKDFGMTPADRSRVHAEKPAEEAKANDPLSRLLNPKLQ
jgi:hypothetical protein